MAAAGAAMFDLSLLSDGADAEELHEKRRVYEDALTDLAVKDAKDARTAALATEASATVADVSAALGKVRAAWNAMHVTAVQDALVEEFPPLP